MQIELITHANSHKSNLIYTDFFINQNFNLILMTYHREHSSFLDSLNSFIINALIDAKLDEIPIDKLKTEIKNFFVTIHTQLIQKFQTEHIKEQGLSLHLYIGIDNKAFIVQFGRLLCGVINQKLVVIGKEWRHSEDELFLLGIKDENFSVKVYEVEFEKNSYFVAIPAHLAKELAEFESRPKKILSQIQLLAQKEIFPYYIIKAKPNLLVPSKKGYKKLRIRITAAMMLIIIILSTLYVFYGKNWLSDQQNLLRMKNQEFVRNELLEKVITAQEVMNQTLQEVYQLEIFPNQKLELQEATSYQTNDEITYQPLFDMHSLYLVSHDKVFSIRKKIGNLKWERQFDTQIRNMMLIDANRLLIITMDKNLYCLNRETGYQIWQKNSEYEYFSSDSGKKMFQISVNRFKQLESSLILIPGVNKITVINNINGAVISEYQFEKEIQYISEFDLIERSLFIIQQNQIKQIRLEIKY